MKKPKLRKLKEAIRALIKGPYTSKFPYEPHKPFERFRGRPEFHQDDCMGCSACFQVCPSKAIEMQDTKNKRILTVRWDMCIFCGQCQANCPTEKGIMLSNDFDLSTTEGRKNLFQTIEKELALCQCCGEAIAPVEQIFWVAKKLASLTFSNTTVMLFYLGNLVDLSLKQRGMIKEGMEFMRSDRIKILCPRCRREAVLKS